ncbi:tRNA(Ile)-lysidine synthetase, partial [Corynebacterium heidelbergense]
MSPVRAWLDELDREYPEQARDLRQGPVVVGVSGGADSLALLDACVKVLGAAAVRSVTVDHQLQEGSGQVAREAAECARSWGVAAEVRAVEVSGRGEAGARQARYTELGRAAAGRPVLVAHTADDDAEGLLLGLARGSG